MKDYRQLIKELPSKTIVCAFGGFNPPNIGHELLVKSVKRLSEQKKSEHVIYASNSQDAKNPLEYSKKVQYLNTMFPKTQFNESANLLEALQELSKKYKNIVLVANGDQNAEVKKLIVKEQLTNVEVITAGDKNPDESKMLSIASKGLYEQFKRELPSSIRDIDGKRLMNDVRIGMGLEPVKEQINLVKDKLREQYFRGEVFNEGDIVESNGTQYMIVKRGSNHLLLKEESGKLSSKWIQDVKPVGTEMNEDKKPISFADFSQMARMSNSQEQEKKQEDEKNSAEANSHQQISVVTGDDEHTKVGHTLNGRDEQHRRRKVKYHLGEAKSSLDKWRSAAAERQQKHDEIERKRQEAAKEGKTDVAGAVERLAKRMDESYEEAQSHLEKAKKATGQAHHMHMAAYHETLGEWHYSKGRSQMGRRHMEKAYNHDKQAGLDESTAHDEGHRDRWYHRKPNSGYATGSQEHKDYMDAYTGKHKQQLKNVKTFGRDGNEVKKEEVEISEDVYTSEFKIKKWVDPVTGETRTRKLRPHRIDFAASKVRGEPAQDDDQGDKGMKEDIDIPKDAPSVESIAKKHGVSVERITKQLEIGMRVEAEHGKNSKSEREIALDHLNERPDYYTRLKKFVESLEEGHKLGDKVKIHKGSEAGKVGHIGEIRHGAFKGAPKTYTVDHEGGSIQLKSTHFKAFKEEIELKKKKDKNLDPKAMDASASLNVPFDPFFKESTVLDMEDQAKERESMLIQHDEAEKDRLLDDISEQEIDHMIDQLSDDEICDDYDEDEVTIIDDETGEELEHHPDEVQITEALMEVMSRAQRMKAKFRLRRSQAKRTRSTKIALRRFSGTKQINMRARRLAIRLLRKRMLRGRNMAKLSIGEKERIDKSIAKRKTLISRIATKLIPRIRRVEKSRMSHGKYTKGAIPNIF